MEVALKTDTISVTLHDICYLNFFYLGIQFLKGSNDLHCFLKIVKVFYFSKFFFFKLANWF